MQIWLITCYAKKNKVEVMKIISEPPLIIGLFLVSTCVFSVENTVEKLHPISKNELPSANCTPEITERIKTLTIQTLGIEASDINLFSRWIEDFGIDSLDAVELIMAMEEEFKFEIPNEDAEKFITVQDTISYTEKKLCKS